MSQDTGRARAQTAGEMADTSAAPARQSRLRTFLEELDLKPGSIVALILGWAIIWIVCLLAQRPLAGIAAIACWLAAVLTVHAWADLRHLRKHSRRDTFRVRPLVHYHWWLAPAALVGGILFGYRVW
jgi:hypothetical protein